MLNKLLKNSELKWTILYQLSILLGGVFLIKLLAVTLSKEDYGYYSLITSISAFILMMPFTAYMQGISRYISIYNKKNKSSIFFTNIIVLFATFTMVYLILSIILKQYIPISWSEVYWYIVLFVITEIFKVLFYTISNANRLRKSVSISSISEFSLKLSFVYIFYIYFNISIEYVLLSLSFGNITALVILKYNYIASLHIDRKFLKYFKIHFHRIWIFSYPLLIWAIFGWFRDMSNRWYLDYFLDKEAVALFAMMSSIALIAPVALQGLIGSYFIPILYEKAAWSALCAADLAIYRLKYLSKMHFKVFKIFTNE